MTLHPPPPRHVSHCYVSASQSPTSFPPRLRCCRRCMMSLSPRQVGACSGRTGVSAPPHVPPSRPPRSSPYPVYCFFSSRGHGAISERDHNQSLPGAFHRGKLLSSPGSLSFHEGDPEQPRERERQADGRPSTHRDQSAGWLQLLPPPSTDVRLVAAHLASLPNPE